MLQRLTQIIVDISAKLCVKKKKLFKALYFELFLNIVLFQRDLKPRVKYIIFIK